MGISSLKVVQCQDKPDAYYLSRAEPISLLVKGISTYFSDCSTKLYALESI